MTWADTVFLLPEIILTAGACLLLLLPVIGRTRSGDDARWWMLGLLVVTAGAVFYASGAVAGLSQTPSFARMFVLDGFSIFFKLLLLAGVAVVVLLSTDYLQEGRYSTWEFYALMAFALCGTFFMVSGVHLISIYIGLELLSLSSYILAGYYKRETKSTEAAMKYFITSAVSSAILLYGVSIIFGSVGSLNLADLGRALAGEIGNRSLVIGVLMLAAGLCFKIAAVPFHVWTPDVYTGAPTPVTAFLSTASKAAAFAIFARIFYTAFAGFQLDWGIVLAVISLLSMVIGNLAAITQDNIKRMLAYSSIAHGGYALLGIIAMNEMGLYAVLIYMLVYMFANLGIWGTILMLRRHEYGGETIQDFEGLSRRAPFWAFAMVIFLLSLGGIPPTGGFIGKYFLFAAAIQAGYAWLAAIAVLMSAVSMFYYLRVVVAMYIKEGSGAEVALSNSLRFAIILCFVITLVLGILPEGMVHGVRESLQTILTATLHP